MKTYIQRRDGKDLETVDEFDTRKEAREMVKEYQMSDRNARLIAAAPELLAALKEAEKELGARLEIIGFPAGSVDEPRARARAAILKAEGQQ